MTSKILIAVACVVGLSAPAAAQTPSAPTTCAPTQAKPNDPNGITTTGRNEPLTDKLSQSGGVLCPPPSADSEMRVPAPRTGSNMPVVPPGSLGGDPSIKPK